MAFILQLPHWLDHIFPWTAHWNSLFLYISLLVVVFTWEKVQYQGRNVAKYNSEVSLVTILVSSVPERYCSVSCYLFSSSIIFHLLSLLMCYKGWLLAKCYSDGCSLTTVQTTQVTRVWVAAIFYILVDMWWFVKVFSVTSACSRDTNMDFILVFSVWEQQ